MTIQARPFARLTIGDLDETIPEVGMASLDAGRVPYAVSEVTIPLTTRELGEAINPHDGLRATLVAGDDATGASRTFNLSVRSREIDHVARKIRIRMESDESVLQTWAPLADDPTPREYETSLRDLVDYVLGKVGAALEAGADDADVTAYWAVTNVLANPSAEDVLAPWTAGGNCALFHAGLGRTGPNAAGFTSSAAGLLAVAPHVFGQGPSVTPGKSYVFSGYGLAYLTTPVRTIRACIRWLDSSGVPVGPDVEGPDIAMNDVTWTRCSIIGTAPVGASRAEGFYRVAGSTAGGQIGYVDDAMFYEGNELIATFTGATADDPHYAYSWAGNANASASVRTPTVVRRPELFVWQAGVPAWEFLEPLTSAAGLRLFCDENRKWRLVAHATYTMPGRLSIAGWNAYRGTDRIDITDTGDVCTGVVIRYRWDDSGTVREMVDAAGEPGSVYAVKLDKPYPGPGAAAAILASRAGRGRTQDVTALSNWAATPSMEASISLPATVEQIGRLTSIEWDLKSPLMRIGTSGLTDAAPGTWLAWDPEQAWEDVDPDLTWEEL